MTGDIPKAGTEEWHDYYCQCINTLSIELLLPDSVLKNAQLIWHAVIGNVSRSPLPLVVDCVYICAKLSGYRASIKQIKRATNHLWGKTIDVLPLDKRRNDRRWVWDHEQFITSLYPDEEAWLDFTKAWKDNVVDPAYFNEGDEDE